MKNDERDWTAIAPSEIPEKVCAFCGSPDLFVPEVGISFGMGGYDYSFCGPCLAGITAEEFWRRVSLMNGYTWPLKLLAQA